jgi:hypothetical protein
MSDQLVYLQTFDRSHWLTAKEGGGAEGERVGDRPRGLLVATGTDATRGADQEFRIRPGAVPGTVGLQASGGAWLSAVPGGVLVANRIRPEDYVPEANEAFRVEPGLEGGISFVSAAFATRIRASNAGGGATEHAAREAAGIDETFFPDPPLEARAGVNRLSIGGPAAIAWPLRAEGVSFADGAGYVAPLGAGCLLGLAGGREPRPLLDQLQARAVQFVRVFAGHLSDRQQTAESARERLPWFLEQCGARGLGAQVCAITDSRAGGYDLGGHVERVAGILARYPHTLLELVNENEHPTQVAIGPAELRALTARARAAGFRGLLTWGATVRGDELEVGKDSYSMAGGDFINAHLMRDTSPGGTRMPWYHEASRMTEIQKISQKYRAPGESGEPNRVENKDNPSGFAYLLGANGRGLGLATVFHSAGVRDARALDGVELAALEAFVRGYRAVHGLAPDRGFGFINGHWTEAPLAGVRWYDPDRGRQVWRAFTFTAGARARVVLCGLPDAAKWATAFTGYQNKWAFAAEIDRVPGVAVVELVRG